MSDPKLDADGKPILGPLTPEEHQGLMADMIERLHRVLASIVATVPALAGSSSTMRGIRSDLDAWRARMNPEAAAEQQKTLDDAEIARLAAVKVKAVQAAGPGNAEAMDKLLADHSAAAAASAENDRLARETSLAGAQAANDRQAALDKAATDMARETLNAGIVPRGTPNDPRPFDPREAAQQQGHIAGTGTLTPARVV